MAVKMIIAGDSQTSGLAHIACDGTYGCGVALPLFIPLGDKIMARGVQSSWRGF